MNGRVAGKEALIGVVFRFNDRPDLLIEFVIDTGFTSELTLPSAAVAALELPIVRQLTVNLADDSTVDVEAYAATVVWDGREREVGVLATAHARCWGHC